MHGGLKIYAGAPSAARHYVEAGRGRADDYYLTEGTGIARRCTAGGGRVRELAALAGDGYEAWVAGVDPVTGTGGGVEGGAGDRGAVLVAHDHLDRADVAEGRRSVDGGGEEHSPLGRGKAVGSQRAHRFAGDPVGDGDGSGGVLGGVVEDEVL